jgi:hypothetical protein
MRQPAFEHVHQLSAVGIAAGVPTPFGRTPAEVGFEKKLSEIISASFDRPTKTRSELIATGMADFGLSRRRAGALREKVIDRLGAIAWKTAGRPRRH